MSLGSWNPADGKETVQYTLDTNLLQQIITWIQHPTWQTELSDLVKQLPAGSNQMMKLDSTVWIDGANGFARSELWSLIQFFTLLEQQEALFHAGDKSPVIGLNKLLKQRGEALTRDEVLWIKANTDNRYLPNGPLL